MELQIAKLALMVHVIVDQEVQLLSLTIIQLLLMYRQISLSVIHLFTIIQLLMLQVAVHGLQDSRIFLILKLINRLLEAIQFLMDKPKLTIAFTMK